MTECFLFFCGQHIKEPTDSSRNEYNVFVQEHFKDLRKLNKNKNNAKYFF